ncbi:MAG: AbrB family transcriptional regulator [Candidatus Nitrosopolaris sp.]
MMGEITSVAKNAKSFASLRTTIPISMVRQWKLKPKDKLYWEWEVRDGKMVAVVMKHEDRSKQVLKKAKIKQSGC